MSLLELLKAGGRKAKEAYRENRREVAEEEAIFQEHYKKGRKKYLEKAGYEAGLGKNKGSGGSVLGKYAPGGGSFLDRMGSGVRETSMGMGAFGGFGPGRRPSPKRRHHRKAKRRGRR